MAVTREQQRVMDGLQAKVRALVARAEAAARPVEAAQKYLGWVPDWSGTIGNPVLGVLSAARELLGNEEQQKIAGALRGVADLVPRWMGPDGAHYRWVQQGKSDDGSDYTLAGWLDEGNAIASGLAYVLGEVHEASTVAVLADTLDATSEELAAAGRAVAEAAASIPEAVTGPWSWKVKAALWVGGGIVGLGAASLAWQAVRATPVGLALRGVAVAAKVGARPLGAAAEKVGTSLREGIERAEKGTTRKATRPARGKA
ncbi:hypothetical protein [Myxococcus sp. RHSTA-1-4]|uniref:hypothetical protein n=1 Tax=Myxococcus sp. RHSTA-1-4 TaxID=2874601 RepID=UPI001CBDEA5E|nr:hypothetical protein [Myxococcus sp. RHSTA-1-4]MBZ4422024.1 hypothetical protein [Myxococcus sp. RHSTA-1-4]